MEKKTLGVSLNLNDDNTIKKSIQNIDKEQKNIGHFIIGIFLILFKEKLLAKVHSVK